MTSLSAAASTGQAEGTPQSYHTSPVLAIRLQQKTPRRIGQPGSFGIDRYNNLSGSKHAGLAVVVLLSALDGCVDHPANRASDSTEDDSDDEAKNQATDGSACAPQCGSINTDRSQKMCVLAALRRASTEGGRRLRHTTRDGTPGAIGLQSAAVADHSPLSWNSPLAKSVR